MFLSVDFARYFVSVEHTVESKPLEVSAFGWQGNRFDVRVRLLQNAERKEIVG